jgi:hypothetical protein
MAPRVRYLGQSTFSDGRSVHEYEDDQGNAFQVPAEVVPAELPAEYKHELDQGFEEFKHKPPAELEHARQAYNEYAARTRDANPPGLYKQPLDVDHTPLPDHPGPGTEYKGVTRYRFPDAQPFDGVSDKRLLGPTQAGPSLSDRPPAQTMIATQVGEGRDTLDHERLHAAAADPTHDKHYTDMNPREREEWRVYSAMKGTEHGGHDAHDAAKREENLRNAVTSLRTKLGLK